MANLLLESRMRYLAPGIVSHSHRLARAILDGMGAGIEVAKYTEKLVPSTRFVAVDGVAPKVGTNNFVAPSASVIGNVTLGEHSR